MQSTSSAGPKFPRRAALVTGSSSGIGVAIARQLGSMGFDVGLTRMPQEDSATVYNLEAQLREIYGVRSKTFVVDFSHPEKVCEPLIDEFVTFFGRLDVLVNNAAWAAYAGKSFMELSDQSSGMLEKFRHGFSVNFEAPMLLTWKAVKQFRAQDPPDPEGLTSPRGTDDTDLNAGFLTSRWGTGRVINTTSVHAESPLPFSSVYTTNKHALRGLTVFLAMELGPEGVTVNAVGPGLIATPQTEIDPDDVENPEQIKGGIAIPRPGRPSEVAAAVGFFASLGGRYTTGQSIYVDGGFLASNPQYFWKFQ